MNRLRGWSYMMMWQIQDGGRPPSSISIFGHDFGVDQHFCVKFGTVTENRQPKGSQCSEIGFSKIQDSGRPLSWISILGHNFEVDQYFCAKFGTVMENRQPRGFQCSEVVFSEIQDGGRPPSWISILGHDFGVDQHFGVFSSLDQRGEYYIVDEEWPTKWAWPGSRDLFFKFWDLGLHNF